MKHNANKKDFEIVPLSQRSAPCCLGLVERTFGRDSAEYRAVLSFDSERRAGFLVHIRRCVVGFIVLDNRNIEHTEILAIAVYKPDRQMGIGSRILHRIVRTGKRKTFTARVKTNVVEAHQFFRSQGFIVAAIGMEYSKRSYVFQKVTDSATVLRQEVNQFQPSKRIIDLNTWNRRQQFELFIGYENP